MGGDDDEGDDEEVPTASYDELGTVPLVKLATEGTATLFWYSCDDRIKGGFVSTWLGRGGSSSAANWLLLLLLPLKFARTNEGAKLIWLGLKLNEDDACVPLPPCGW